MKIADREIGPAHPPYVIAEISCNHGGSLKRALELMDAAKLCGADAVKFQAYTASTITLECDRPEFTIKDGPWAGRHLWHLYKGTETPFNWFPEIKRHADDLGITWFASVFDRTAVDLMVELDAPALKIASFEIVDIPLIKYAAATGKPLILSTGMATHDEAMNALTAAKDQAAMLQCVSGYPADFADVDLLKMRWWWHNWATETGISDHTLGSEIAVAATALGANIIEKHFKLFWHPETEDSAFSMDEIDFAAMVRQIKNVWHAMQEPRIKASELPQRPLRRSLFVVRDMRQGEPFDRNNVRSIRPGDGLPPVEIDKVLGRAAARDIERGEPLAWGMIE